MSHHIVTVCMFCLLCAAHTCTSHVDVISDIHIFEPAIKVAIEPGVNNHEKRKIESEMRYQNRLQKIRQRREVRNINPEAYVEQIFRLYGDVETMTMNMTGFNKMLEGLDFHKLTEGGLQKIENKEYIYGQNERKEEVVNVSLVRFSF